MHVAHKISFHETSEKDLEERRDRFVDVKPIDGTQTHYHFYFPSEGAVDIRYLTCLCVPCRKEQWQACVNKGYVGVWKRQQLQTVRAAGVRKHNPQRSKRAHAIADSLTGEEAAVALYTSQPERAGECFWLMKPSKRLGVWHRMMSTLALYLRRHLALVNEYCRGSIISKWMITCMN